MSGITPAQYINLLHAWNIEINKKQKILDLGYKVYKFLGLATSMSIAGLTGTTAVASSLNYWLSQNIIAFYVINSIILAFSILATILTTADMFMNFKSTSNQCAMTSKQYSELYREIQVRIAEAHNTMNDVPNIALAECLEKYSVKEQLILQQEPGMIFLKNRRSILEDAQRLSILLPEEITFFSQLIMGLPESPEKVHAEQIIKKVFEQYGIGTAQYDLPDAVADFAL